MLKSVLCDSGDAYILESVIITAGGAGADTAGIVADRNNKKAMFENCASFTDCISAKKKHISRQRKRFGCCYANV